jgi:hypothetical protein
VLSSSEKSAGRKIVRTTIEQSVSGKLKPWAKIVGLNEADQRLAQFREDLIEALHACIGAQMAALDPRLNRQSDLRAHLLEMVKAAESLITGLRDFNNKYTILPRNHIRVLPDGSFRTLDLVSTAEDLEVIVSFLEPAAKACVDKGGAVPLLAFQVLANGLVRAYRHATGETGKDGVRQDTLHDLLDAVLPTAKKLIKSITGKPLEFSKDPGQYLYRTVERL